jgi:glycosyltransferase 2 family protein
MTQSLRYRWLRIVARAGIILLVVLGIGQAIRRAVNELQTNQIEIVDRIRDLEDRERFSTDLAEKQDLRNEIDSLKPQIVSLWNVKPTPLLAALMLSIIGLLPSSWYWMEVLRSFQQKVPWVPTFEAYFLGHLGKYIPGKAMVFVLRLGRLRSLHVPLGVGTVSIFIETLTVMAVGAAVGGVMLQFTTAPRWLQAAAWLGVVAAAIPTVPGLFANLIKLVAKKRIGATTQIVGQGLTWTLFLRGWASLSIGWLVQGIAVWLVVLAIRPGAGETSMMTVSIYAACTAAATLSIVAGFVSFLPGGAGVRELVIILLLGPIIGTAPALFAAILLRLISLAAEVVLFITFNLLLRCANRTVSV